MIIQIVYFIAAILFILGLKRLSSPKTATSGIKLAGIGMLLAIIATFLFPDLHNFWLIFTTIFIGTVIAWISAKRVAVTAMPEMIAMYNGMGGGAASAIATIELLKLVTNPSTNMPTTTFILAIGGALIGNISFSGSILAFFKLRDWLKNIYFPRQQLVNLSALAMALLLGCIFYFWHTDLIFIMFFATSIAYGVLMTMSIGGADMPVVISLYNAFTGLAVASEGFVINNIVMIIAGTLVGSAGSLLTLLMAKAMNRSLSNILFTRFGSGSGAVVKGNIKSMEIEDAAIMLNFVNKVVFIPGYGMAVAQAQQKVWELASLLLEKGIEVKFAIHSVAGRMPGHMNVLLAEAGVPYDYIVDMDDINNDFPNTDVVIVIGANDVVNPAARTDKTSSIYGMPILNADYAKQIFVIKRGTGKGYAGIENLLFFNDKCRMVYGDAKQVITKMIQTLKEQE
ncbi:MAG: NAD(P)(+) transhydrogenase (Re/Si-specific) subunit beta [Coxiellaceae bacterium]|jgi:NAD(P) transhydrogenase subunit beta|nr:NAD(P)(+) transhydrogenase (Re/Si-specific) subunit beta [Coxiellaceae bacterium]